MNGEMEFKPDFDTTTRISLLQRWVIVHSIVYYVLGTSVVSDLDFDSKSRQLVGLMNTSSKEECEASRYWYCMHDFDGMTGFDLYSRLTENDRVQLLYFAQNLINYPKNGDDPINGQIRIDLRDYQKNAIAKLQNGNILCAGTGAGKSMTALAYYYIMVCLGVVWNDCELGPMMEPKPLYIITTAMKRDKGDWNEELARFGLAVSSKDENGDGPCGGGDQEAEVVVDSWNNLHKYTEVDNCFFIFDEQRVVGKGEWVKSFWKVTKRNEWILLTATPGDSWKDYMPVFVANGFYKNQTEFFKRHATYVPWVTKFPKIDETKWREVGYLDFLRRKITVLMKAERHTKRHYKNIIVPYDKDRYWKIVLDRWNPWEEVPVPDISSACYLMRRAANSGMVSGEANHKIFVLDARSMEIVHLCCEHHPKLIIFYNYDYELEAMKKTFDVAMHELQLYSGTKNFAIAEWNGHKHDPLPTGGRWVYLVQYSAGSEGWNCVETDAMVFYSMNYSYKAMEQAAGRIDRMNTKFEDLYYYILKSEAPIEGAIQNALDRKETFNEALFWSKEMN